jgi:ABC-type cobalamin/Fe3+-siderophores transport system ATPase subunit
MRYNNRARTVVVAATFLLVFQLLDTSNNHHHRHRHHCDAFVLPNNGLHTNGVIGRHQYHHPQQERQQPPKPSVSSSSLLILFAKSKVKTKTSLESLEALESQVDLLDAPISKKEQMELLKKQKKTTATTTPTSAPPVVTNGAKEDGGSKSESNNVVMTDAVEASSSPTKAASKKDKMLAKALELEALEAAADSTSNDDDDNNSSNIDASSLSKKELKALKKKEEKMAEKALAKAEKKKNGQQQDTVVGSNNDDDDTIDVLEEDKTSNGENNDEMTELESSEDNKITLEDKIRKERPPPRIRVMESAQPGYVSLRLENVGITFRNQEVLKDVTWGVQSGDRIGLVGKNGAGKTTQLRILSGELEPTTGDVVKSSNDLRTAILRQEFVDELVKERTLKEEFMSVFAEENQILLDLRDAEKQLESMGEDDTEAMQDILDRMQDLQRKADDKDVYVLESKVKKTMDLMGFTADESEDLVASFSGGWKMRIGLGKVLLKEPNILLLGK